jgi:hypothetical protein
MPLRTVLRCWSRTLLQLWMLAFVFHMFVSFILQIKAGLSESRARDAAGSDLVAVWPFPHQPNLTLRLHVHIVFSSSWRPSQMPLTRFLRLGRSSLMWLTLSLPQSLPSFTVCEISLHVTRLKPMDCISLAVTTSQMLSSVPSILWFVVSWVCLPDSADSEIAARDPTWCCCPGLVLDLLLPSLSQVDAWDHDDYALNSAIGRYDGNVYQVSVWVGIHVDDAGLVWHGTAGAPQ